MDTSIVVLNGAHAPLTVARDAADALASRSGLAAAPLTASPPSASPDPVTPALPPAANAEPNEIARLHARVRELAAQLVHTQETVRRQLAQELHDSAGAELTASHFALANVTTWLPADAPPQCAAALAVAQRSLDAAADATRGVIDELHAPPLQLGIVHTLSQWTESFAARTGLRARFACAADDRFAHLPADAALAVFRVAQEALNNVAKHARARGAEVRVETDREHLTLTIADDGIGLPHTAGKRAHRFGLAGMRARCEAFDGELSIDAATRRSTGARGTTLYARFAWRALLAEGGHDTRHRAAYHG